MSVDPVSSLSPSQYRAAVALAEAIIPGSAAVPAADESTMALATETVAHFSPALLKPWAVAHQTLDAAAVAQTGRPFHSLSAAKQDELIRRWERDPVLRLPLAALALVYKFVHFDKPAVYDAMGGRLNVVQGMEQPRWLSQVFRAEEWQETDDVECEVVVVGTGAGGAVVGRELADRGYAVVFVEEGELHRRDAFDGSSLRAHQKFYRGTISLGNAVVPVFMGRLVGGSTAINTGTCFRTPPWVLDRWCEDIGTDEFAREKMDPHFAKVERTIEVGPADPRYVGPIADVIKRGCNALGWSHFPVQRNAPGCQGEGFCDFGCRTDARKSTNLSYIPPALEKGSVLLTGLRAERVLVENGRAVGVEGVAKNGRKVRVRARAVILAGGAVPTPLFLLKQGLANRSGQVGRNLSLHPSAGVSALFDHEIQGPKHIPQGYGVDQFLKDGILIITAQPDHNVAALTFPFAGRRLMDALNESPRVATFGVLVKDATQNGRVWFEANGHPAVTYNLTRADVDLLHQGIVRVGEFCRAAGAKKLYPVVLKHDTIRTDREWDAFRRKKLSPADFVLTSYHPLGTCRMGKDPKTSVVGLDHQTHDVPGLYVVDGSTVPGPTGVNPQVTIMAMATRAAGRIAENLG